jgi:hypothetical protein
VATPTGWAAVAVRGLNFAATASGSIDAAEQAMNGNWSAAFLIGANVGLARLRGLGEPCKRISDAAFYGQKALNAFGAVQGAQGAVDKFKQGDYVGAFLDTLETGLNAYRFTQSCFTADTPIQARRDGKQVELRFDQLREGDEVLSCAENEPQGPVQWRRVEEIFVRTSNVLNLHVGCQVIRTTAEHPFYVLGKGWIPAGLLEPGDPLRSHDGRWLGVEAVTDSGEVTTVYNCRVAEYHTYFVGATAWGFTVWAHNADCNNTKGTVFENLVTNRFVRKAINPFFRTSRRAGFDVVTLEGNRVVINEAKFANRLQYDDFSAITTNLRRNAAEVQQSLAGSTNLDRAQKAQVRSTLDQFLSGGIPNNLSIRVITGNAPVGPRLQERIANNTAGLPVDFVEF